MVPGHAAGVSHKEVFVLRTASAAWHPDSALLSGCLEPSAGSLNAAGSSLEKGVAQTMYQSMATAA